VSLRTIRGKVERKMAICSPICLEILARVELAHLLKKKPGRGSAGL
jgi:hypothetical protein